jgi:phosphohistidine phosphatase
MARQLWLLRHAEAEPHGTRADAERRLTARGEAQARTAGIALARLELAAEQWIASRRARLQVHRPLADGFHAGQALDALSAVAADGRLLLVGHEPDLSGVVNGLTGGLVDLKKGGLAVVRLEGGDGVVGELAVLMRPRELALIAGVPADGH